MAKQKNDPYRDIRRVAEAFFGKRVTNVKAPGGSSRASCQLRFPDQTVFATNRPNFRRTHLEAVVLRELSQACDSVPKFLGYEEGILFQEDVGGNRLNVAIQGLAASEQEDLADLAVAAIFKYQAAARDCLIGVPVPPLGVSPEWVIALVDSMDILQPFGEGLPDSIDRASLCDSLSVSPDQFVKWDCRSGNAALNDAGRLSWFDFEYCGRRHGAEDFSFLIADEVWPVAPMTMLEIVADNYPGDDKEKAQEYFNYLSLYTTFHALQRLSLILREVTKRGWRSKSRILRRDDVGKHPDYIVNISQIGAFFAERDMRTRPLVALFEDAVRHFSSDRREQVPSLPESA